MKTFTYSPYLRFLYRYGNIPVTVLLIIYAVPLIINLDERLSYILPITIVMLLIYFLNKRYLSLYNILPYKIYADDEKLTGTDYQFSKNDVIIYFKNIAELKGGIFEGKLRGAMRVVDGQNRNEMAFYQNINNAQELQTIILSKVSKDLYEKTLENIKSKRNIKRGEK